MDGEDCGSFGETSRFMYSCMWWVKIVAYVKHMVGHDCSHMYIHVCSLESRGTKCTHVAATGGGMTVAKKLIHDCGR
jgi:hypothetical protein